MNTVVGKPTILILNTVQIAGISAKRVGERIKIVVYWIFSRIVAIYLVLTVISTSSNFKTLYRATGWYMY